MSSDWDKLPDLINDDSFCRWIRGEADQHEQEKWILWVQESPENKYLMNLADKYLKMPFKYAEVSDEIVAEELQRLHLKIQEQEIYGRQKYRDVISGRYFKRNSVTLFTYAAFIALIIGIVGFWTIYNGHNQQKSDFIKYETIKVPYGQHELLKLADGSEIILHANSELRYPQKEHKYGTVNVWLKGEAYFSVIHNPNGKERAFRVHTNQGVVTDLGTQFVVRSDKSMTSVILVKGEVGIQKKSDKENSQLFTKLRPGEMAQFNDEDRSIRLKKVHTEVYTSWIHNKLVFDETPFTQVIREIQSYYGVKIVCLDKNAINQKISGTVNNSDLYTVLKGIGKILDLKVEYKNNIVVLLK